MRQVAAPECKFSTWEYAEQRAGAEARRRPAAP